MSSPLHALHVECLGSWQASEQGTSFHPQEQRRRAEQSRHRRGPPAPGIDDDEFEMLARLDGEGDVFPEQRVVRLQYVPAGLDSFTAEVEADDHVALLNVARMVAADGDD